MTAASLALRQAMLAALTSDSQVLAAIGAARVYDEVPRKVTYPYIVFTEMASRDASTDACDGEEHGVRLHIWSRAKGIREAETITQAVRAALHDQSLVLDGHRLVNLRLQSTTFSREADGRTRRGVMQFRAVTEVDTGA